MFTNNKKRISLLRYWTSRYLLTLCIGLAVITIVSALWIRHTTLENRVNMMKMMSEEIAYRVAGTSEVRPGSPNAEMPGFLDDRGRFLDLENDPSIYIVDAYGITISSNRPRDKMLMQIPASILASEENVQKLQLNDNKNYFYVVKTPISSGISQLGWVVVIELEENLTEVKQEYRLLAVMIISLALLGWVAIYFLSRRLSNPIKDVAEAAKQVQAGNYDINLPGNMKEQEVYELVHSFKEMSERLQKLEALRTELLAGVTHELKTPVTSVSGLLQALNDDVVAGAEAKEFLALSLKETAKMKKLVEDLLEFNTFAANAVPVSMEEHGLNELMKEILHEWKVVQEEGTMELKLSLLPEEKVIIVDSIRLQQIITNLLNNAKQAMDQKGMVDVRLGMDGNWITIEIADEGPGIPEKEQSLIFERFYRGEEKKYKVRGLGLGLPFSKMIAQSLGGDLQLYESSPAGTTFRVILPVKKS